MGDLSEHFDSSEFACGCGCDSGKMDPHLIEKLEEVRVLLHKSIIITSGIRCADYNELIGGVQNSAHVPQNGICRAVDIYVTNSQYRYLITPLLWSRFQRIGFGKQFYHVDTMENPDLVMWDYYNSDHVA
jgi:uncharacterized protein YcbK (DUF882 family)